MDKPALLAALALFAVTAPSVTAQPAPAADAQAPAYVLVKSVPLGAPDRWDYVVYNNGRVYVAHGDRLAVIDAKAGTVIGEVTGIAGGTHGTGISVATSQGYTDDGRNGLAEVFDLKTLKIARQIPADKDADAIATDRSSGHVFIIEGEPGAISVIDPRTNTVAATIQAGERLEFAAGDDRGTIYVAGEEKKDLLKIDARANRVAERWPTPDCTSPHGVAVDPANQRVFMGCINARLMVVDARFGKLVADLPIGRGSDAVAFDPKRKRVFSSNGLDGTISVYQQTSADSYTALAPITTAVSGRTMAVDPATGRLFVAAAETDPPATPSGRPRPRPGTLRLMIFEPVHREP